MMQKTVNSRKPHSNTRSSKHDRQLFLSPDLHEKERNIVKL